MAARGGGADEEAELPRVVALAWGIATEPTRGPKRELSHERIVEAAIELADEEGLGAVTMQRVAQAVGFTTMALYRYVSGKDELQALMFDAAVDVSRDAARAAALQGAFDDLDAGEIDWRGAVRAWAGQMRAAYRAHPWLLDLRHRLDYLFMPGHLRGADELLGALEPLGLDDESALAAVTAVTLLVRGYAELAVEAGEVERPRIASRQARAIVLDAARRAGFSAVAPLLESQAYFGGPLPLDGAGAEDAAAEEDLGDDYALEALLDGIAARAAGRRPASGDPAAVGAGRGPDAGAPAGAGPGSAALALERAEAAYREGVARRRRAEQRVKQLVRAESALQRARDAAKAAAQAADRAERAERKRLERLERDGR